LSVHFCFSTTIEWSLCSEKSTAKKIVSDNQSVYSWAFNNHISVFWHLHVSNADPAMPSQATFFDIARRSVCNLAVIYIMNLFILPGSAGLWLALQLHLPKHAFFSSKKRIAFDYPEVRIQFTCRIIERNVAIANRHSPFWVKKCKWVAWLPTRKFIVFNDIHPIIPYASSVL
jgi:hypothetical protein